MNKILLKFKSLLPEASSNIQKLIFISIYFLFFLYALSIPTFSSRYPLNYVTITICGLMCFLIIVYLIKFSKFYFDFFVFVILLFNISIFITHLVNFNFSSFPKTILLMSLVGILLYEFLKTHKSKNLILYCLLAAGIVFSIVYIVHYRKDIFNFSDIFNQRLGSFFDNENEIAKEFAFFAVISLTIAIKFKKIIVKILFLLIYLLFVFLILSTGSISNLLTIILVTVLSIIICQKTNKGKIIATVVSISIIAVFLLLIQLPQLSYFKKRIDQIINVFLTNSSEPKDGSASNRLDAALTSFAVGSNRLILGFGYMSASSYTVQSIQSHNNFAELFIDFGLLGLFIFEIILIFPILFSKKSERKIFAVTITLEMFIFQFFLTTYYKKIEYILIAYIFSIFNEISDNIFVSPEKSYVFTENNSYDKGKKTLIEIIPSFAPIGGAEMFVYNFCASFKEIYGDDINLIVVSLYKNQPNALTRNLKNKNINLIELDKKRGFDPICIYKLRLLLSKTKPWVIHTHLASLFTLRFSLLFMMRRSKIVHTIHQNFPLNPSISDKFEWYLIKKHYVTAVCVAKKPSDEYSNKLKIKIPFINNGVNLKNFNNKKPLFKRDIDFLVAGRFVSVKNHKYLLEIFNESKKNLKFKCVFLGDGPLLEECKRYVIENNLEGNIEFHGCVNDVGSYMANSKILLMPSINEGNPMVINEAFASGMVVVANDVGGISDLLKDKEFSYLAIPGNKRDFCKKMFYALDFINKSKLKKVEYDKQEFSIDKTVQKYFNIFIIKNEKKRNTTK